MSAAPSAPRHTFAQRVFGENPTAWAFVLPAVVIIIGLSIVPIGWSLLLSFNSADLITPAQWVGLANYKALAHDPALRDAIVHTLDLHGAVRPDLDRARALPGDGPEPPRSA